MAGFADISTISRLGHDDSEFRRVTLRYLLEPRTRDERDRLFTELQRGRYTDMWEEAMTIADTLRGEGIAAGKAQGLVEGRALALVEQIENRFGALNERDRARISQTREETRLRAALIEILDPQATRESVLEKLQ